MQTLNRTNIVVSCCLVFCCLFALGVTNVQAQQDITIELTAEVTGVYDVYNLFYGRVNVGDILTGTYTYNLLTQDSDSDSTVGTYKHSSSPYGILLTVGGFVFQTDPDRVDFLINVRNSYPDSYSLISYNNLPLNDVVAVQQISWQLRDLNGNALDSDALPSTAPALGDWQATVNNILISGVSIPIPMMSYYIQAHVTSASVKMVQIIYVDAKATGANDGSRWEDAYNHLQDALADANSGTSILVAQGIYYPDTNSVDPNGSGDRKATFQLKNGVTIKGGYVGNSKTGTCCISVDPNQRDIDLNCCCECEPDPNADCCGSCRDKCTGKTILSGEIGDPNTTADNSYHVVTGSGTQATAVLENVTITHGNADGNTPDNNGGGMINDKGSPTVRYCCFVDNNAADAGGAMYNSNFSSPTLTSNSFCSNAAKWGAGIANYTFSSPELQNCVFMENDADQTGGGVSNMVLSKPEIVNCTFYSNKAGSFGGGIYCNGSDPNVYNSIMWDNNAPTGKQIALVANNRRTHIAYCDLQGGKPGVYRDNATVVWNGPIMDRDPNFVDPNKCNLRLRTASACLDASNNSLIGADILSDRDGRPRFVEVPAANPPAGFGVGIPRIADLGAYERPYVIYVGPTDSNDPNGTSWQNAHIFLQDALAKAMPGDQIWVAAGIYTPDRFTDFPNLRYHPEQTFKLGYGVGLYGGFDGNETDITDRAKACTCEQKETILSGDLLGNDNYDTPFDSNFFENSWNVVTGANDISSTAILDGFTIKGGYANGTSPLTPWNKGGGMHNLGGPTIRSCCFEYNWAYDQGGAMYNEGSPTLANCEFKDNFTRYKGAGICNIGGSPTLNCCTFTRNSGGLGGGMYNEGEEMYPYFSYSRVTLVKCTFTDNNSVHELGGAMYNSDTDLLLCDCNFVSNEADIVGGAMCNVDCNEIRLFQCRFSANKTEGNGGAMFNGWAGDMQLTNCAFLDNMAANSLGGGMCNASCLNTSLINCTFRRNQADEGGAIYNGFGDYYDSSLTISNSILWGDTASYGPEISLEECQLYVNDSILQGGEPNIFVWGTVSIHEDNLLVADPLFVDAEGRLDINSPAIDAGNNDSVPRCSTMDLDGQQRIMDGDNDGVPIVDMGVYEFHDCDFSGFVNLLNFAAFAAHWQETGCNNENNWGDRADLDMSGIVDNIDLCMFLRNWLVGRAPEPPR